MPPPPQRWRPSARVSASDGGPSGLLRQEDEAGQTGGVEDGPGGITHHGRGERRKTLRPAQDGADGLTGLDALQQRGGPEAVGSDAYLAGPLLLRHELGELVG